MQQSLRQMAMENQQESDESDESSESEENQNSPSQASGSSGAPAISSALASASASASASAPISFISDEDYARSLQAEFDEEELNLAAANPAEAFDANLLSLQIIRDQERQQRERERERIRPAPRVQSRTATTRRILHDQAHISNSSQPQQLRSPPSGSSHSSRVHSSSNPTISRSSAHPQSRSHSHHSRPQMPDWISALPEFECSHRKQLEQECQICMEQFQLGEIIKALPCLRKPSKPAYSLIYTLSTAHLGVSSSFFSACFLLQINIIRHASIAGSSPIRDAPCAENWLFVRSSPTVAVHISQYDCLYSTMLVRSPIVFIFISAVLALPDPPFNVSIIHFSIFICSILVPVLHPDPFSHFSRPLNFVHLFMCISFQYSDTGFI